MYTIGMNTCCIIIAVFVSLASSNASSALPASANWHELAAAGDYAGALRALDAARLEVVKPYAVVIKQALPKRIGNLNSVRLDDNSAMIQIMFMQWYKSATAEIRVDLVIPTVDVQQHTRVQANLAQNIKDFIRGSKRPSTQQMEYLILQGFAAQIRRDTIFAARPQMMAYLDNGAAITVHSITDIPLDEFKKLVDDLPLRKIDKAIRGATAGP
jgi:hypothetical protein